jgi:hypothetical protein
LREKNLWLAKLVIPTGASRRLFFAFASCERVGSRSGGISLRSIREAVNLSSISC